MDTMTSDACCTRAGWIEYYADGGAYSLHISAAPDADLDGTVTVFDHDEQQMIRLNGWLWTFERIGA